MSGQQGNPHSDEGYGLYLGLRRQVLAVDSAALGTEPDGSALALAVDMWMGPGGTATITAVRDGTASVYLSSGGALVGSGDDPQIAAMARDLVGEARRFGARMSRSDEAPLPAEGSVRFNLVTEAVVLAAEAPETELGSGEHPLAGLYSAAHELLAAIRAAAGE